MITVATFHSELPLIISGSEDGTIKLWNSATFKLEQTLNYGLERAWAISTQRAKSACAVGFDDGMVVFKLGRETPGVSMDPSGKIIYSKQNEILTATVKSQDVASVKDAEPISLGRKELGSTEVYPTSITHSPNGRFVAVVGDGEWICYTSLALRNQSFGQGLDFVWATKELDKFAAVRESTTSVKILKQFKASSTLDVGFSAEGLFGGALIGVKGAGGVGFYDWTTGQLVRRIEVEPRAVYWNEAGELVALATETECYVLRFDRSAYEEGVSAGQVEDDGVEAAFEVVSDFSEVVTSATWTGDVLLYTSASQRLSYLVGEKSYPIATFDNAQFILGYLQRDGKVYVADKVRHRLECGDGDETNSGCAGYHRQQLCARLECY
jgi:coatomer subunit beta'